MTAEDDSTNRDSWREKLHEIIFEADTQAGKSFDIGLIVCILLSVTIVILDSVSSIRAVWGPLFTKLEWGFTVLFTIEYLLRILTVKKPIRYALSFFGVIDLLAILPTYLSLFMPGTQSLTVIRILRVLRIFRIFKLAFYLGDAEVLSRALHASRRKITVFLFTVFVFTVVLGASMYVLEGEPHGFTSIPQSIYWAIVTLTTVGYGDIVPHTNLGQLIASLVMILGYAIIAVPTGIVTVELTNSMGSTVSTQACPSCGIDGHGVDAKYCRLCGDALDT
jgi:voltage-gated potassium channel